MIDLTPLEVRKKKGDFRRIMRGYDPATVDDFIDLVADRLEELVRDNLSLAGRLSKQDQQVTEYRERERALTDALVSAQEMREEVRRQTTRDAELARQASEQETSQLKRTVEEETAQLRAAAEREAAEVRDTAQREADAMLTSARQEAAHILSGVRHERERNEDALQRVQAMQRQLVDSYRSLLERELEDLDQIARGVAAGSKQIADMLPDRSDDTPSAASTSDADSHASFETDPVEAAPFDVDTFAADTYDTDPFEPEPFEPEPFLPDDGTVLPPEGDALGVAARGGVTDDGEVLELDTEDEDLAAEAIASLGNILGSLGLDPAAPEAETPTSVDADDEMELYDSVAPENPDDGVPGPIGLSGISLLDEGAEVDLTRQHEPRPTPDGVHDGFSHERGVIPVTPPPAAQQPDTFDLVLDDVTVAPDGDADDADDVDDADDADDDTARLLRNAAAAGYRVPEEDELLLSDAVDEEDGADDDEDDPWLPTLLEEEDR